MQNTEDKIDNKIKLKMKLTVVIKFGEKNSPFPLFYYYLFGPAQFTFLRLTAKTPLAPNLLIRHFSLISQPP